MFKTASDLMGAWWSLLGMPQPMGGSGVGNRRPGSTYNPSAWTTSASAEPGFGNGEPAAPIHRGPALDAVGGPAVRLEISSRRPIDVTVDLRKRGVAQFRVLDLRAEQGDAPRIPGTTLDASDPELVRIRLTVPDDQPPGTYHAVILDAVQDLAVGTVTLKIPD